ncbi:MAG TPA: hypothetical protein VN903_32740 [Polyangia bacterium]|nr:hypothetical protein [Polyangia bacterium]
MGTAHLLFPPGITDIRELPAPHFDAIRTSLMFLGFEEMPEGDAPPRTIWLDDEALTDHFKRLKARRKEEMDPKAPQQGGEMKQNSLAKDMVVG